MMNKSIESGKSRCTSDQCNTAVKDLCDYSKSKVSGSKAYYEGREGKERNKSDKKEYEDHRREHENRIERTRHKRKNTNSNGEQSQSGETESQISKRRRVVQIDAEGSKGDNFTFESYRHEMNRLFGRNSELIQDFNDFWLFVSKYAAVQTKAALLQPQPGESSRSVTEKSPVVNLSLSMKQEELRAKLGVDKQTCQRLESVVLLYLDFKQKEKFAKLKKLRNTQASLPVSKYKEEILAAVGKERVVVIAGDTGCGKSTQIPQYLLKAGYNRIACTQPRRIACVSLAKRVAFETLNEYGSEVGYQIRFEKTRNRLTKIIFVTEGLLLRQVSGDGSLSDYDVILLDEVHERHLHGDFLLGVVKCLLHHRPDLKVVLMSATINVNLFAGYFGDDAAIIQIPGRLFPIKLQYRPVLTETLGGKSQRLDPSPYVQIMQIIDQKYPKDERGDLLIFMSGMSEITSVVEAARQYNEKALTWIILPLHSTLSILEQDKVFDCPPEGIRKCIVSTNMAETSITIDGIRFVADSGKVKEMSYDSATKMQRLKEFTISRASAEQRKGRAGRTGPGVCFRLYTEEDYAAMAAYTTPEIEKVPLDSLVLQMVCMGLPDARKFPFIEPPPPASLEHSILSLKQHGALSDSERVTVLGQMLSKLPCDIPLGKMLIMGSLFDQIQPTLSLAAALSVQSPFTSRAYRDPDCETSRKSLESDHGDPVTLLNALREWLEVKSSNGPSRQWCKRRGLEEQRFYEMVKLRQQFHDLLQDSRLVEKAETSDNMSSAERALRHGELKLLRAMRPKEQDRKRSTLKVDTWTLEEEEKGVDVRDVDFRIRNDRSRLQDLLSGSSACSYRDLTMLKLILASGLYPQVAVPDEFNHCKSVSEQLFHTKGSPFVRLHPMGFFANNAGVLHLNESDIIVSNSRHPVSSKHQILFYMVLLETTKPYLVNTLRVPAAQTLLLFAHQVHTNADFSRVVCDSWLELRFQSSEDAEHLIIKTEQLRGQWEKLLELKLQDEDCGKRTRELSQGLVQLMNWQVVYSMSRLLAADLKVIYAGPGCYATETAAGHNPVRADYSIHANESLGGLSLAPHFTYDCLVDEGASQLATWTCLQCGMPAALNALERLQHLHTCQPVESEQVSRDIDDASKRKPNSRPYDCHVCGKLFYLTPLEILKHKKEDEKRNATNEVIL